MRRILNIFILSLFFFQSVCLAQMIGDAAPNTPQWQLNLDVIKAKARSLSEKNSELMGQYNDLMKQDGDLQLQIRDWQLKNENLKQILKDRRGRSDQQIKIEELTDKIKARKGDVLRQQKAFELLKNQAVEIEKVINLKKLKISDLELHQRQKEFQEKSQKALQGKTNSSVGEEELTQVQQKWQAQKDKEAALQRQLNDLKQAKMYPLAVAPKEEDLKPLELKIQELTLQKEGLQNKNNVDNNPIKVKQTQELMVKKKALEVKIKEYEAQLNQLKNSAVSGLNNNDQRKQVLREMVALDSRNDKLRHKISDLRQDILLLKDQVNRLERKVNFVRGAEDKKK